MNNDDNRKLYMEPAVRALLEERGIREEDLRQVLAVAEGEGGFHSHRTTGHRLAHATPGKVTYWVEYVQEDGGYRIFTAYSHRMKILEGFNMPPRKEGEKVDWLCATCDRPLEWAAVKLAYLDETFVADLPACPACQRVLVSEENAVVKMAMAERMLEDK
jgi:hypothetical protein